MLLGLCALVLLTIGGGVLLFGSSTSTSISLAAGCLRVGGVVGAIWLALPQLERMLSRTPRWLLVASGIALVLVVIRPQLLLIAVPALLLLWILGPRLATKADAPILRRRFKKRPPQ